MKFQALSQPSRYLAKRKLILPACCYLFYVSLCVLSCFCFACLALGVVPSTTSAHVLLRTCGSPGVLAEASWHFLLMGVSWESVWEVREREGSPIIQSQALSCACFLLVLLQPSRRKFSMNFAALQFVFFSTLLRSFFASHSTPRPLNATRLNSIRLGVQLQSSVETTTSTTLLTVVNNKTASGGKGKVSIG